MPRSVKDDIEQRKAFERAKLETAFVIGYIAHATKDGLPDDAGALDQEAKGAAAKARFPYRSRMVDLQ